MNVNLRSRLKKISYFGLFFNLKEARHTSDQSIKIHVTDCSNKTKYGHGSYHDGVFEVRVIHREHHEFYTHACATVKGVLHAEYFQGC